MANISNYLEEALLNHVFRNVEFTRPGATIYIGLFANNKSSDELEANNRGDEITTYASTLRIGTAFGAPAQDGGKATITNTDTVEFTVMPATTVGFIAAFDNSNYSTGNILYWAKLTADKPTSTGDTFRMSTGNITFDLD